MLGTMFCPSEAAFMNGSGEKVFHENDARCVAKCVLGEPGEERSVAEVSCPR